MTATRTVCFLTGTRADFGKLKPLMTEVMRAPGFDYRIFATGMHMLSRYGSTVDEIRKAGFENIYPFVNQDGTVSSQMDMTLAHTLTGLGHYLREFPPDLLVVHGDRVETLAGAIAGVLNNVLVAHIEGGEVSGTVDELLRHAVTKLAHIHFVANEEAESRLIQMGEHPRSVFQIGSPDVDVMLSDSLPSLDEVKDRYEIPFDEYCIFLYHPVVTELPRLRRNVKQVLDALVASKRQYVAIYPNSDAGAETILEGFTRLRRNRRFRVLPSLRFEYFLSLLRHARAIVGNSSAGVREAPVYGVPTLNIGTRQMNRARHSSIVNVPEDRRQIVAALDALPPSAPSCLQFGRGQSAERFLGVLRRPEVWRTSRQKQFRDVLQQLAMAV